MAPPRRWWWRAGTLIALSASVLMLSLGPYRQFVGILTGSPAANRSADCLPGAAVPIMDSPHISNAGSTRIHYNSEPPTSGPHFSFPVSPGIYGNPVPDGLLIHALEHGHVVIQYGSSIPAETVTRLQEIARRYPRDVVLAPRDSLAAHIALTAWGRLDRFIGYDRTRIVSFVEKLRDRYDHGWTKRSECPDRSTA